MLKVNEEKILIDYNELQEKKNVNLANIEAKVRPFALSLGYDEEKTKGLIDYVQKQNGDGLTEKDSVLLEILSFYVDEVEEPVEETEVEDVAESVPEKGFFLDEFGNKVYHA